jgi:hypothetical protein
MATTVNDFYGWLGEAPPGQQDITDAEPVTGPVVEPAYSAAAFTISLSSPLKVNQETVSKIVVRQLLQGDIDDLGNGILASNRDLLCRLTGLDNAVIRALVWADSERLHKQFANLLPDFLLPEDAR